MPFRHPAKPALGIEVFRLSDLYARAARVARRRFHCGVYALVEQLAAEHARTKYGTLQLEIIVQLGAAAQFPTKQ